MIPVLAVSEMLKADRKTIDEIGVAECSLVEVVGREVARIFVEEFEIQEVDKIIVFAGSGNNGADALCAARALFLMGYDIEVVLSKKPTEQSSTIFKMFNILSNLEVTCRDIQEFEVEKIQFEHDLFILDGLSGTGFSGDAQGSLAESIVTINNLSGFYNALVCSIDIPSGLNGDRYELSSKEFVSADLTLAIQACKPIHLDQRSVEACGDVVCIDVGIVLNAVNDCSYVFEPEDLQELAVDFECLPPSSHKGNRVRVLIIGGFHQMEGAAVLSGLGALRSGASLVHVVSTSPHSPSERPPEIMWNSVSESELIHKVESFFEKVDVVVVGPGLGSSPLGREVLELCLSRSQMPLVIDADAIEVFASMRSVVSDRVAPLICTPHPKEAIAIFKDSASSVDDVLNEARGLLASYASAHGVFLVLKGPTTLFSGPDGRLYYNPHVAPSLSIGGSGDVLSGILGAVLGDPEFSIVHLALALYLHGEAGLLMNNESPRGGLASDIAHSIPIALQSLVEEVSSKSIFEHKVSKHVKRF